VLLRGAATFETSGNQTGLGPEYQSGQGRGLKRGMPIEFRCYDREFFTDSLHWSEKMGNIQREMRISRAMDRPDQVNGARKAARRPRRAWSRQCLIQACTGPGTGPEVNGRSSIRPHAEPPATTRSLSPPAGRCLNDGALLFLFSDRVGALVIRGGQPRPPRDPGTGGLTGRAPSVSACVAVTRHARGQ